MEDKREGWEVIEIATQHTPGRLFTVVPPHALLGALIHRNDNRERLELIIFVFWIPDQVGNDSGGF